MLRRRWSVHNFNNIPLFLKFVQVMPGDNVEMVCSLVHDVAAEVGSRFTLREGGKTS
jgi:elongation factor Tu